MRFQDLVSSFIEKNDNVHLSANLNRICDSESKIKEFIDKELLSCEKEISDLNLEYFALVPEFYHHLEKGNDEDAKKNLSSILEIDKKFSDIVKEILKKELQISKKMLSIFQKNLSLNGDEKCLKRLVNSIESSYHLYAFPRIKTFDIFVDENAGILYQQFCNVLKDISSEKIEKDKIFEEIKDNYFNQSRRFILHEKNNSLEASDITAENVLKRCQVKVNEIKKSIGKYKIYLENQIKIEGLNLSINNSKEGNSIFVNITGNYTLKQEKLKNRYESVLNLEKIIYNKISLSNDDILLARMALNICLSNKPNWSEKPFLKKLIDVLSLGFKPLYKGFFSAQKEKKLEEDLKNKFEILSSSTDENKKEKEDLDTNFFSRGFK